MYLDQSFPLCENGCGKASIRLTKKGKAVCSERPAGCPAILLKMQQTSYERYGVTNASSSEEIKDKRKQKALDKYGVDNVSKAECIKAKLSEDRTKYWEKVYAGKEYTNEGLSRLQYSHRCMQYSNT
jgi:hypothetical protein